MKIIIIGGVAGGATLAARLRRNSETDQIIMFEKDEYIAFANCGLPYYIGDVIKERDKLFVQTVNDLSKRYNLDIRNHSKVIKIDEINKTVEVEKDGATYLETYDKLVLSPGAEPLNFGFEAPNMFTLRNIADTDRIKNHVTKNKLHNAIVIGGGFIGVEMAENLAHLGIKVTLIDNSVHILKQFDIEMAAILETSLKANGVNIILKDTVEKINESYVELASGATIQTDITILAIGVKPLTNLANNTSIELTNNGAFKVDNQFKTSVEDIYAIGDAIEVLSPISNKNIYIPLAWPANRQGRILADIIHGSNKKYPGTYGASIIKVNNLSAASVGFTKEHLDFEKIPYQEIIAHRNSHASYYPNSNNITMKVLYCPNSYKILGAQAIGISGVDKRIDVIATAMQNNMLVMDLQELELCYAPPYNSAKDPVNIIGYIAENIISNKTQMASYNEVANFNNIIDVRTSQEHEFATIDGCINIDIDNLRNTEIPFDYDDKILVFCQVGLRGYLAEQILRAKGYKNVYNLNGGFRTYNSYHKNISSKTIYKTANVEIKTHKIDARSLQCPGPIMQVYQKMAVINIGEAIEILVTDNGFCQDIEAWCNKCGHKLITLEHIDNYYKAIIEKQEATACSLDPIINHDKGTIVLFSGDMDKALGAMIIAQGAQAMGKQMTIFCTFWGLNLLRKDYHVNTKKTLFEKMFGFMMPRGAKKAQISNMKMFGMGTKMIKFRMKDKNVVQLSQMIIDAQNSGVNIIACTMSMELMGIKEEELINGVEFGGVATYIGESSGADLTLFI